MTIVAIVLGLVLGLTIGGAILYLGVRLAMRGLE